MPENNFENEVQQSLGGLKIHPTAAVWNNLEKVLQRRKKRRFALFFFVLAGVLLTGSGTYLIFNYQSASPVADHGKPAEKNISVKTGTTADKPAASQKAGGQPANQQATTASTDTTTGLVNSNPTPEKKSGIKTVGPVNPSLTDTRTTAAKNPLREKAGQTKIPNPNTSTVSGSHSRASTPKTPGVMTPQAGASSAKTSSAKTPAVINGRVDGSPAQTSSAKTPTVITPRGDVSSVKPPTANTSTVITGPDATKPKVSSVKPDTSNSLVHTTTGADNKTRRSSPVTSKDTVTINKKDSALVINTSKSDSTATAINRNPVKKDSVTTAPVVKIKKVTATPKMQWVFGVSGGVSDARKFNKLSLSGRDVAENLDVTYNTPSQAPGLPLNTAAVVPPSESHPGLAFQLSAGLQRNFTKHSSLFAGLGYSYVSNRIRVGDYRMVAAMGSGNSPAYNLQLRAYTGYPNKSFTDKYHIITLPVRYQFIINPSGKNRVQWNAAITPGYLFSMDALIYTPNLGGSYYRDKHAYNRFRLNAGTGIDLLVGKGKLRWSVGPEVSVSLNKLISTESDNQQYLYYGGVSGRIYLGW
ncbi:MAG: hypothetical protein ABWZ25_01210 [Chitinophagaceae bacterium]